MLPFATTEEAQGAIRMNFEALATHTTATEARGTVSTAPATLLPATLALVDDISLQGEAQMVLDRQPSPLKSYTRSSPRSINDFAPSLTSRKMFPPLLHSSATSWLPILKRTFHGEMDCLNLCLSSPGMIPSTGRTRGSLSKGSASVPSEWSMSWKMTDSDNDLSTSSGNTQISPSWDMMLGAATSAKPAITTARSQ
eukprot:CAMPEP_0180605874 /NCGR_PEP_ID=MMETSP1037_2-20121125/26855_1 /TAXON_ID=632150 /ORGANISM="Azadinium spinosum, Strain 3D9" /LENGTH=196 /DNA_ID=CAMNT_0022625027 /DNA_START=362 /DNA_END=950 /DNA_ORIENTATION=+